MSPKWKFQLKVRGADKKIENFLLPVELIKTRKTTYTLRSREAYIIIIKFIQDLMQCEATEAYYHTSAAALHRENHIAYPSLI